MFQAFSNILQKIQLKARANAVTNRQKAVSIQFCGLTQHSVNAAASQYLQEIEKIFGSIDWSDSPLKQYIAKISANQVGH